MGARKKKRDIPGAIPGGGPGPISEPKDPVSESENTVPSSAEDDPIPDLSSGLETGTDGRPSYGVYGLPSTCDVFEPNPEVMARQKAKGLDTKIDRIYIYKMVDGKHERIPGQWAPEEVNSEFLAKRFGSGSYFVRGVNQSGVIVTTGRIPIGFTQETPRFGSSPTGSFFPSGGQGGQGNNQPPQNMIEMLMFDMMKEKLTGGGNAVDPMRGAMAEMMKMQAMQTQSMMQMLQMQVSMKQDDAAPQNEMMKALMVGLMGMVKNGAGSKGGAVEEAMGMLTMGLNLGRQMSGASISEPKEDPDWLKAFGIMAESFGPAAAAIVAQTLPNEQQREAATSAINEHMKARQAEAHAESGTIETEGIDSSLEGIPDVGRTGT